MRHRPQGRLTIQFVEGFAPDLAAATHTRHRVDAWLGERGLDEEVQHKVALAVSELCTNAVRASSGEDGTVCVVVEVDDDQVVVVVANAGEAFERPDVPADPLTIGGRGLAIVEALSDELQITHEDGVTLVGCRVVLRPA